MKNWQASSEYKRMIPLVREGDVIDMPEISTEAFTLVRDGRKYKAKIIDNEHKEEALRIYVELLERGWDLPALTTELVGDQLYAMYDWVEGESGREKYGVHGPADEPFYYKLGQYIGKLNNEMIEGLHVSVLNHLPRNIMIKPDGEIFYCDEGKFYLTDFPEAFIEKYIITEDRVTFPEREAFLKGYREHREYDLKKVIKWHFDNVYEKYHDIYLDGELFAQGNRPFKSRLDAMGLPKDMTGWNVLDLGCSGGMFSLECARRGANYTYGCDVKYKQRCNGRAHHRLSDMTKLIAYYHGFYGGAPGLHFKHVDINTEWFIKDHIPAMVKARGKFDLIFAMAIVDHLDEHLKGPFFRMLSESTDLLIYESRMGGRRGIEEMRLQDLTTFDSYKYLGNMSDNTNKFEYALFKCSR